MTDYEVDLEMIREDWAAEADWCQQTDSGAVPPYSLDELVAAAELDMEADAARPEAERGLFMAAQRVIAERETAVASMTASPLTDCYVPEDWWLFLEKLCEKRIAFPGMPLVMWISGGIRAGKSFICALLMVCHWLYFRAKRVGSERVGCGIFCACTKMDRSSKLQQRPMKRFMPSEATGGSKGVVKDTLDTKLKFKAGHFTDDRFMQFQRVEIETGEVFDSGGECEFGAETQVGEEDTHSLQGIDLTAAWLDEGKTPELLKTLWERAVSTAVGTRQRWHRELMIALLAKLKKRGTPEWVRPTPYELGQLMWGVVLDSYTPKEGWNSLAASLLTGANYPEEYMRVAPELVGKPGVIDPRVPLIAYPTVRIKDIIKPELCLVCFLHTSQNKVVNSYTALSEGLKDASEEEIRKTLYGMVGSSDDREFEHFGKRHIVKWKQVPRVGTLVVTADQGMSKPWSIDIGMWDKAGRYWLLMSWPSPGRKMWIMDKGKRVWIDPGPWAMPSDDVNKVNGKKGKIARTKPGYTFTDYTHLVHQMLQEVLVKFKETGEPFQGKTRNVKLEWHTEDGKVINEMTLEGEFAVPASFVGDKNWLGNMTQGRKKQMCTLQEALRDEENHQMWQPYEGRSARDGIDLIQNAISADIGGLPGLLVVEDCTDTIFSLNTYGLPDGKDSPPTDDQANKEGIDKLRYAFGWGQRHIEVRVDNPDEEWGL